MARQNLEDRNNRIVELHSKGISRKEIAKRFFLSVRTVETIIQNLRREHGCKNIAHLIGTMVENKTLENDTVDFELRLSVMLSVRASHTEEYYKSFMKAKGTHNISHRSLSVFMAEQDCREADYIIYIAKNQSVLEFENICETKKELA